MDIRNAEREKEQSNLKDSVVCKENIRCRSFPEGHWIEVPKKEMEFNKLTHDMLDTFIKKNADYGDSTTSTFNEFGLTSYAIRLSDKLNRIKTYCKNKELNIKDENVVDTLIDMANYCLLAIIDIKGANDAQIEKP